jgi:hypothetical protein
VWPDRTAMYGELAAARPRPTISASSRVSLLQLTGAMFVLVSLFPWVSFGTNSLDSQPWALLLGSVFLYVSLRIRVDIRLVRLLLLVPAVLVIGLLDVANLDFRFYRAVYGYASVPLLIVGYYLYVQRYGVPLTAVKIANLIYLAVAMLQQQLGPTITGQLTVLRTTPDRGVPSLAVEPTYFGILLVVFSWIIYVANDYRPRGVDFLLAAVNVLFVVFVARSSMAILFLMLAMGLAALYRFRLRLYLLVFAATLVAAVGYMQFLQTTRVGAVVRLVQDQGPLGLIKSDASVNQRVAHAVFPWHGAISTLFVPHGFSSFADSYDGLKQWYGGFFWYGEKSNVIMSYAGAFVFELGWVGLLFLGYLFYLLFEGSKQRLFELTFLFALLNSALPVAFPLIPLMIALLYGVAPSSAARTGPHLKRPSTHGDLGLAMN